MRNGDKSVAALFWAPVIAGLVILLSGPAAAQSDGSVRISLINGIPDSTVDIDFASGESIADFAFRDTYDLSSLAGSTAGVVVSDAASGETLLEVDELMLPATGNVSVLLHLKVDGSVSMSTFENDLSRIEAGNSRLVVRHLAAAPEVDVLAAGEVVFEGLGNGQERSADLAAGEVSASLVPSGEDGPVIVGPADLPLIEGDMLIVYGLGSLDEDTMTVITETITGLDTPPTGVDTGNSAVSGPGIGDVAALTTLVAGASLIGGLSLRRRSAAAGST